MDATAKPSTETLLLPPHQGQSKHLRLLRSVIVLDEHRQEAGLRELHAIDRADELPETFFRLFFCEGTTRILWYFHRCSRCRALGISKVHIRSIDKQLQRLRIAGRILHGQTKKKGEQLHRAEKGQEEKQLRVGVGRDGMIHLQLDSVPVRHVDWDDRYQGVGRLCTEEGDTLVIEHRIQAYIQRRFHHQRLPIGLLQRPSLQIDLLLASPRPTHANRVRDACTAVDPAREVGATQTLTELLGEVIAI